MRWLLVLSLTGVAYADDEAKPLPVKRSRILNQRGVTYYVEGRQAIPWGCEISIARDVTLVGRGDEPVLEVAGSLHVHGTENRKVVIRNLVIEPAARFEEIRLDAVDFNGGGGLRNSVESPVRGRLVVDNSSFNNQVAVDVALGAGKVQIIGSTFHCAVRITGVVPEGKMRNDLDVHVNACKPPPGGTSEGGSGFVGGLFVTGANKVLVRNSRLGGEESRFENCTMLTFDGNRVGAVRLVFDQTSFAKTKLQKSDFYCDKLVLKTAPRDRKQRVLIDKCWFKGLVWKKDIEEQIIEDGKDGDESGAVAMIKQLKKNPLRLGD